MNGTALRLSQKSGGDLESPLNFRGCHPRGLLHLHYVSLVGVSRISHGEGGLASFLPKLDAIVEAGFCLVFHVVL